MYRTLNDLEMRLDAAEFLRIHRSAMVRVDQIAEGAAGRQQPGSRDAARRHVLVVSRSRAAALKGLIL